MANVKVPYALTAAVAVPQRREHMRGAIARGLPRLARRPPTDAPLYVACYGPSLRDTFEQLRGKHPLVAMSGATKWLAERGIVADYHLEMDPRPSQLVVSLPPVPGVTYLVASCVVPEYFDRVREAGSPIVLWHTVNSTFDEECRWVAEHDPDETALVVHAGSTVGLAALHVGGVLGHTRFEIHGMDGSFGPDGARHAGAHGGKEQAFKGITWAAGGRPFQTTQIMANAVAEAVNTAKNFPIVTVWHGDGLTQALIREGNLINAACADEAEKVARLRGLRPQVVQAPPLPTPQRTFWEGLLAFLQPTDLPDLVAQIGLCEPRRARAAYNTGTVPFETAVYLRALSRFYEPTVIAEVGTFIGTSTLALRASDVLFTCDRSNDCVPPAAGMVTHPRQSSTEMLRQIDRPVDLFFFDGRIQADDIPEIRRLMHHGTVFVFDDFTGREKGVVNVELLAPHMPTHTLIGPAPAPSTVAVAVPTAQMARGYL